MATKIQQILETAPNESVLFDSWLSSQGLDARGQYAYMKVDGLTVYRKEFIRYTGQNQVYLLLYRHTTRNLAGVAM